MLYENAPSTNTQLSFGKSQYSDSQTPTPLKYITGYNNYYEFGADKDEPAKYAGTLKTRPWTVSIEGEVKNRETIDMDALMKPLHLEDRFKGIGVSRVGPW